MKLVYVMEVTFKNGDVETFRFDTREQFENRLWNWICAEFVSSLRVSIQWEG